MEIPMKKTRLSAVTWIVVLFSVAHSFAQVEVAETQKEQENEGFYVDAISFAGQDRSSSRLDVFLQTTYENLTFIKVHENYEASFEVTISIYDTDTKLVREKNWRESIKARSFDESVSTTAYSLLQRSFDLAPGKYFITVMLQDEESHVMRRIVRQMTIPKYDTSTLSLSDIMLVSRITYTGEKRSISPLVSANVGTLTEPFHVFFESYSDSAIAQGFVSVIVQDSKKNESVRTDTTIAIPSGRNPIFLPVDARILDVGDYVVYVLVKSAKGEKENVLASTSRKFVVRWSGLPRTVKNFETAVEQLAYIAEKDEMEYINEGSTSEEKQHRLAEFWKKKDPNPNTARNEKMEEYYSRVEYANKNFSHYIEGWRTDMGMVFIIFGSPSNVDRHPFDMESKPYEIWTYYELNHSFTFVDESGFGDYHLTTPIWEVWQRLKN